MRNIYNQKDIQEFIESIIVEKDVQSIFICNWMRSNLKNFIIKKYNKYSYIRETSNVTEEWAKKGVLEGNLISINIDSDFKSKIKHVVDYLSYLNLQNNNQQKDFSRLNVDDAIKQSIDWVNSQKKVEDDINGRKTILSYEDGFYFVEINSEQAIDYEGSQMNHCLALYHKQNILNGKKIAFSLRDKNNKPHATIMYNPETYNIEEIKGVSNSILKPVYQEYIADFLNDFPFKTISDYDYIPNVDILQTGFAVLEKKRKGGASFFHFKKCSFNLLKKGSINGLDYRTQVHLFKLKNSSKEDISKIFDLSIGELDDDSIFSDIKAKNLTIHSLSKKLLENNLIELENEHIVNFALSNNNNNKVNIKKLNLKNCEYFNISSKHNSLKIDTLDLSECENLKNFNINNVLIEKLILPDYRIQHFTCNQSNIKSEKISSKYLHIVKSEVNSYIEGNILKSFENIIINKNNNIEDILICDNSDKFNCKNIITPIFTELNDFENCKKYFSNSFNGSKIQFVDCLNNLPEINERLITISEKETIKFIDKINDTYKQDFKKIIGKLKVSYDTMKNIDLLDIYNFNITKITSNNLNIDLYFRKDILDNLKTKQELIDICFFESLRCMNPEGVKANDWKKMFNSVSENVLNYINTINETPYLGFQINSFSNKLVNPKVDPKIKRFFKQDFENEEFNTLLKEGFSKYSDITEKDVDSNKKILNIFLNKNFELSNPIDIFKTKEIVAINENHKKGILLEQNESFKILDYIIEDKKLYEDPLEMYKDMVKSNIVCIEVSEILDYGLSKLSNNIKSNKGRSLKWK